MVGNVASREAQKQGLERRSWKVHGSERSSSHSEIGSLRRHRTKFVPSEEDRISDSVAEGVQVHQLDAVLASSDIYASKTGCVEIGTTFGAAA